MSLIARIALLFVLFISSLPSAICAQPFGPDTAIDSKAAGTMQRLRTTTAFNGWIYSAYNTISGAGGGITIRQSKDNGQSWTTVDEYSVNGVRYPAFDLIVTGSSVANLQLFVFGVRQNTGSNNYSLYVDKYNADTGAFVNSPMNYSNGMVPILDVAIASDYRVPAFGASPYGVSIAWISGAAVGVGQIKYRASIDAGATFPVANEQTVATTAGFYRSLSLAYGRSAAASNGRYFVAWDEFATFADRVGKLFTSRNSSATVGPFVPPVRLDDVAVATTNKCSTPKIAVQHANVDNDAGGPTAVVLANCEYDATPATNILGFYNKRAHFTNVWLPLALARIGTGDQKNATVAYNTQNNTFVLTYLDAVANALVFKSSDYNLPEPNA
jgi:hypothetical protein